MLFRSLAYELLPVFFSLQTVQISIRKHAFVLQDATQLVGDNVWVDDGTLSLTEQGQQIAQQIYEKHQFFTKRLVEAGVPQDIAAQDACKLEYVISEISFKKLKEAVWINDREVIPSEK